MTLLSPEVVIQWCKNELGYTGHHQTGSISSKTKSGISEQTILNPVACVLDEPFLQKEHMDLYES